jgi:HSP20 family protein
MNGGLIYMFKGWKRTDKGLFDEIEREFEEINELMRRMSSIKKPLVYGFTMHVGPDGVPHVEHFGNFRPEGSGSRGHFEGPEQGVREPFTSSMIDEKKKEFNITADMPGVEKDDIEVNATENEVIIKAERGDRSYFKKIQTPLIDPDSPRAIYNNGVLEVTFKLKDGSEQKAKRIKIE